MKFYLALLCFAGAVLTAYSEDFPTPIDFKVGPTPIDLADEPTPIDLADEPTPIDFKIDPTPIDIDLEVVPTPIDLEDYLPKLRCSKFREMELEDRFRRDVGKERVFTKYCNASPNSVLDNYCECNVVPRSLQDSAALVDKSAAKSFLSVRAQTRAINEECCNEGCNLEEVVENAKITCP